VPELAAHFLAEAAAAGLPAKTLDPAALDRLKRHSWPGNVRELENLIRRLAALYPQETIGPEVVEAELAEAAPAQPAPSRGESLSEAVERHLRGYFAAHRDGIPAAGLYDRVLREIERPLLQLSLAATRGNQIRAAELLGLNRNTLRKKLRELEIEVVRGVK
jgi:two-component system nitrogen regulation response regulator GlnG